MCCTPETCSGWSSALGSDYSSQRPSTILRYLPQVLQKPLPFLFIFDHNLLIVKAHYQLEEKMSTDMEFGVTATLKLQTSSFSLE